MELSAYTSPTQTATPLSMSDAEVASSPETAESSLKRPGGLSEGPNARSKSITTAEGDDTYGVGVSAWCSADVQALNCHPSISPRANKRNSIVAAPPIYQGSFRVGVSEDRNKRCRRTMEDAHSFVYDYGGVRGQGYFAVFEYV